MKERSVLLAIGTVALFVALSRTEFKEVHSQTRTTWEYKEVHSSAADLNQLGAQGWELVAVATPENTSGAYYYLKRAK